MHRNVGLGFRREVARLDHKLCEITPAIEERDQRSGMFSVRFRRLAWTAGEQSPAPYTMWKYASFGVPALRGAISRLTFVDPITPEVHNETIFCGYALIASFVVKGVLDKMCTSGDGLTVPESDGQHALMDVTPQDEELFIEQLRRGASGEFFVQPAEMV